jgi:hypothetical protein
MKVLLGERMGTGSISFENRLGREFQGKGMMVGGFV